MADTRLIHDVSQAEGVRLTAYKDTLGNWTAGVGHLLPTGKDYTGFTITQEQCDEWLNQDLTHWGDFAKTLPEWPSLDTACRQNAVIELCFNMGRRWLGFVNARGAMQRQDWQTAHDQMLSSGWAAQVHGRATRLASYILTGQYP